MFIGWDFGTKNDHGLYDTGMCQECGKRRLHTVVSLHKHFIISIIPVYISNRYYKKCDVCDKETLLDKKEAKLRIKQMAKAFPTKEKAKIFFKDITDAISNNEVIRIGESGKFEVDENNKSTVKNIIWKKYRYTYEFPQSLYNNFVEYYTDIAFGGMYSANLLLDGIEKIDTIEKRLKKINDLYEKKLISEEEYQKSKDKILNDL